MLRRCSLTLLGFAILCFSLAFGGIMMLLSVLGKTERAAGVSRGRTQLRGRGADIPLEGRRIERFRTLLPGTNESLQQVSRRQPRYSHRDLPAGRY